MKLVKFQLHEAGLTTTRSVYVNPDKVVAIVEVTADVTEIGVDTGNSSRVKGKLDDVARKLYSA